MVDVAGLLTLESSEQGTIHLESDSGNLLTIDSITLADSDLILATDNGLQIDTLSTTQASANMLSLTTTNGAITLGAIDAGSRSEVTINSADGLTGIDQNSVLKAYNLEAFVNGTVELNTELDKLSIDNQGTSGELLITETTTGGDLAIASILSNWQLVTDRHRCSVR